MVFKFWILRPADEVARVGAECARCAMWGMASPVAVGPGGWRGVLLHTPGRQTRVRHFHRIDAQGHQHAQGVTAQARH